MAGWQLGNLRIARPALIAQNCMDHGWTEEHENSFVAAAEFARAEINPTMAARMASGELSRALWRRCAAFGLFGLTLPKEQSQLGGDTLSAVRAWQGLGFGCLDAGWLMALGTHAWCVILPIAHFASAEQRARYLPALLGGEAIGAIAITETEHGSDVRAFATQAAAHGAGYVLRGAKAFITNAPAADLFLVFAATEPAGGYFGTSAFLVERSQPGVCVGPPLAKMGLRTSPMAEMTFDDVALDPGQLLGEAGAGQSLLRTALEWERGCLLAPAVGIMERLLAAASAYCMARHQFGRPIGEFEAVGHQLAEMKLRLECSRLLLEDFARRKDAGIKADAQAAMVKLHVSESWSFCAATALHLHGAYGYCADLEFERNWRDAVASTLYSGTSEMQRNAIAESLLTRQREHALRRQSVPA